MWWEGGRGNQDGWLVDHRTVFGAHIYTVQGCGDINPRALIGYNGARPHAHAHGYLPKMPRRAYTNIHAGAHQNMPLSLRALPGDVSEARVT